MGLKDAIQRVSLPAPAKINLFLAVTGKRADGFHDLVSVMAKLGLADLVTIDRVEQENHLSCVCNGTDRLNGVNNLAEDAVQAWRTFTGIKDGLQLTIHKEIPIEAGLGGGSSDAVATLLGLNAMMDNPLSHQDLIKLSAEVGSDCPSFLILGLCVAQGRGERVRATSPSLHQEMQGKPVLLFKPPLGFSTADIFEAFSGSKRFSATEEVRQKLIDWESCKLPTAEFLSNDLEFPIWEKHLYIPALFRVLQEEFGLFPRLSGSGSCCFCIGTENVPWLAVEKVIRLAWGDDAFVQQVQII